MSTALKNLSPTKAHSTIPNAKSMKFGIVLSEWNPAITHALYKAAFFALTKNGAKKKNIKTSYVPGSFELPLAAHRLASKNGIDAVICLGCIIKGETPHFDFISQATANTISQLNILHNKPIIFGVLTTNTLQQAKDRSGGKLGNKGEEAAITAIKMASITKKY